MKMSKLISLALVCAVLVAVAASVCPSSVAAKELTFLPETRDGKIYGIPASTTYDSVDLAYYNAVVDIFDRDGNAVSDTEKIGTGYTVKLNSIAYSAVVMGDVDGDGEIKTFDYVAVKRAYLGTAKLGVLETEAAGVKPGKELGVINYIMIKRAYFGTYDMNKDYACDPYDPSQDESGWTPGWV
ncbi:MAG: hypothetical protein IKK70_02995 [Clostridia bacterium]|nr:hypothetical protein [Clostridia bacterium]